MKYIAALLVGLFALMANAQAAETVAASANVSWTPPTTNTDGSPLTDLKEHKLYVDTSPITDATTVAPIRVPVGTATYTYKATVANGATLYFRLKACNAVDVCSVFTPEVQKRVLILVPGVPTGVQVTVTVTITTGVP